MADRPQESEAYLAEHVRETLAQDPRVGELDVRVTVRAGSVVLSGTVATPERRDMIEVVAREQLPDYRIDNEIVVGAVAEPSPAEHLP